MNSEWPTFTVEELEEAGSLLVEDGNHGEYRPRPDEFRAGGTTFIRAADMSGGRVLFDSAECINEVALRRIRKGVGRGGDVLFSHKGTVGKLALVPLDAPAFVCSPQTTFWRTLDESRLDRRFLYYFMTSQAFAEQWRSRKGETDMADYVSLTAQRKFSVAVPAIEEQRGIARILGALDDKIEANVRVNGTSEAIAQCLFKAWFVDFEPVAANVEGRNLLGLKPEVGRLFPRGFVATELGPVPDGWRLSRVGDELTTQLGGTPARDRPEYWTSGTIPWINSGEVNRFRITKPTEYITNEGLNKSATKLIPARTTVLAITGATLGQVSILEIEACVNQSVVAILQSEALPTPFIYFWVRENIEQLLARRTGAAHQHVNKNDVNALPVLVPGIAVSRAFGRVAAPLFARIGANSFENDRLVTLRNTLLPKLLSGQIRAGQSEKVVEQAV